MVSSSHLVVIVSHFFLHISFDDLVDPEVEDLGFVSAGQHVRPGRADAVADQELPVVKEVSHGLSPAHRPVVPALGLQGFDLDVQLLRHFPVSGCISPRRGAGYYFRRLRDLFRLSEWSSEPPMSDLNGSKTRKKSFWSSWSIWFFFNLRPSKTPPRSSLLLTSKPVSHPPSASTP